MSKADRLKARVPRGFADRGAADLAATENMLRATRETYELYGFEAVETPFVEYTEAQYERVFAVNTKGTFFTLQQAAKRVRDGGRIIVISSNTTGLALPGFAVYGASKLAPRYFVEVLAKELGPRNITVNSVVPGVTLAAGVFTNTPHADPYLQEMTRATPLCRLGTPEDVANAVLLLASERAAFVTGHHLVADGGAGL